MAKIDLSVQMHPNNEYVKEYERQWGKTKMWDVLEARYDSSLIYRFNHDTTLDKVYEKIGPGSVDSLLNHVPVHKDAVFHNESGTVHAIGAGCLVAGI